MLRDSVPEMEGAKTELSLEEEIAKLRDEKLAAEKEFGNKRAVFKTMYMEKENEVARITTALQNSQTEKESLQRQLEELQAELNDVKTAAAVSEVGRQDEIDNLRSHYQEEVASLQHIVRESVAEAVEKASAKYAEAKQIWREERQELQSRLDESRRQGGWRDKDPGVLDVFAKTFRRMTAPNSNSSVGAPTSIPPEGALTTDEGEETEAENLEEAMRRAQADVDMLKSIVMPYEEEIAALKHKVREAYAQIDALEEQELKQEVDRLRRELEVERGQVEALRRTWQLHQQTRRSDRGQNSVPADGETGRPESSPARSSGGKKEWVDGDGLATAASAGPQRRALSNQDLPGSAVAGGSGSRRGSPAEVRSLFEFGSGAGAHDEFFNTGGAGQGGQRVVSEREWTLLQQEVTSARRRLARPCELCGNYEDQLQTLQGNFAEKDKKLRLVQSELEKEKKLTLDLRTCLTDLETKSAKMATEQRSRIDEVIRLLQEKEGSIAALRSDFNQYKISIDNQLEVLFAERDQLYRDLTAVQREHESLLDRHSSHSRLLQSEHLELPTVPDELQLIVLQLREELITSRAARDHIEEKLRGELSFLRDQMKGEQQEKAELEASVQDDLARLHSIQSEYEREKRVRAETESDLARLKADEAPLRRRAEELETEVTRLRQRSANLTGDLATAEEVQKDFVRLSQSLQIQLERLRQEQHSLRWQNKGSAANCTSCRRLFGGAEEKRRCKHCVRIFCPDCCGAKTVDGVPVCDVCHTLLVQDAVPFFSEASPSKSSN